MLFSEHLGLRLLLQRVSPEGKGIEANGLVICQWNRFLACIGISDQILIIVPKEKASCKNGRMGGN